MHDDVVVEEFVVATEVVTVLRIRPRGVHGKILVGPHVAPPLV